MKLQNIINNNPLMQFMLRYNTETPVLVTPNSFSEDNSFMRRSRVRLNTDFTLVPASEQVGVDLEEAAVVWKTNRKRNNYILYGYTDYQVLDRHLTGGRVRSRAEGAATDATEPAVQGGSKYDTAPVNRECHVHLYKDMEMSWATLECDSWKYKLDMTFHEECRREWSWVYPETLRVMRTLWGLRADFDLIVVHIPTSVRNSDALVRLIDPDEKRRWKPFNSMPELKEYVDTMDKWRHHYGENHVTISFSSNDINTPV